MSLDVRGPVEPVRLDPGDVVDRTVTVRNTSGDTDRYTFEVVGVAAGWTTVEPPCLVLEPGTEAAVRLRFHPPRAAHVRAGESPFGLVTVAERALCARVTEGLLLLGRFERTCAELVPPVQVGRRATYLLEIHNDGNAAVHLATRIDGLADGDRATCSPPTLTVRPGTTGTCVVRVRTGWQATGEHTAFRVVAQADGAHPITVVGSLLPAAGGVVGSALTRLLGR